MNILGFKSSFGAMSVSELEARLKKRKEYKDNLDPFLRLSEDLFHSILFSSLRVPFESSLMAFSTVCKYWNQACINLEQQLFDKCVPQARLPRSHMYVDQQHMQLCNFDKPHRGSITPESMEGIESHINTCQITALPKELLPLICSYAIDFFSKHTLKRQLEDISLVCKDWHRACVPLYLNAVNTFVPLYKLIKFNSISTVVQRLLKFETSDQKLLSLNFSSCELSDDELPLLTQLKHLQKLNLADTEVNQNALLSLAQLPALRVLNFMCDEVAESEIGEITQLTHLKTLSLSFVDIRDCGLRTLAKLTQLRALALIAPNTYVSHGYDHELQALTLFTDLKHLKLQCEGIQRAGYESLWKLTQLRSLHLGRGMRLGNNTVRRLTALRKLSLATSFTCIEVTLQEIAQLTQLEALILPKISCEGLEKLTALTRLTSLNHAPIKGSHQEPA